MIINEYAGSGGDYMPWMFRRQNIGQLIGKRTWGGLVGIGGYPVLIDGGSVTAPHFAFYSPEGQWEVENHGVSPDIEVEMDPKAWRQGRDPQLEKGGRGGDGGASEEPAKTDEASGLPELPQRSPASGYDQWRRARQPRALGSFAEASEDESFIACCWASGRKDGSDCDSRFLVLPQIAARPVSNS
jgi:hypothetical protein